MAISHTTLTVIIFLLTTTPSMSAARNNAVKTFRKLCNVENFDEFLTQTGKVYHNEFERKFRESLFVAKKAVIDLSEKFYKEGASSYKLSINPLIDMTRNEVAKMTGSITNGQDDILTYNYIKIVSNNKTIDNLPDSFDWREKHGVTPAKFQGFDCGSCWSFAAVGALEGHIYRRTGILVPLSEQNLIDCASSYGCMGCDGGFQEYAFDYIRENGISFGKSYPYIQKSNLQCLRNITNNDVIIRGYARIKPGDEIRMKEVIATLGPLACSINGSPITFEQYSEGIYDDDECNKDEVNHSIVVVGYGSKNGKDFWIIKNSYSSNWGENGFMRLLRNNNSFCGIANECSYPVL